LEQFVTKGRAMIIYQGKNSEIEWLEAHKTILKTFSGFIMGYELHEAFNAGYTQLKNTGGKKWLSDNRKLPVYRQEDITWINEEWFPRMLDIGWKYWALLEPESHTGAFVMKKFQFYIDKGITLQTFTSMEEALAWLDSFPD
jgi:hypothetical protein